jgi:hypothetical protein
VTVLGNPFAPGKCILKYVSHKILIMTYRSSAGSSHSSGRGGTRSLHEKAKTKGRKHQHVKKPALEETDVRTPGEVNDRTLTQLSNLGKQKFATSPFREHFSYWLANVKAILSEFESEPSINVDEQFTQEVSALIGKVENDLDEWRRNEIELEEVINSYSHNRITLGKIETSYCAKTRELEDRKTTEISRLSKIVDNINNELSQIALIQAGFFRGTSKKAKVAKQEEAGQRLSRAEKELDSASKSFAVEQKTLDEEFARTKASLKKQMDSQLELMENQEVDLSLETRSAACNSLMDVIRSFMQKQNTDTFVSE